MFNSFFLTIRESPSSVMVRLGEHDMESKNEPHTHVDIKVKEIIIHHNYDDGSQIYNTEDVALLRLVEPVDYAINVIPICLPENDDKLVGETGWVKGYGCQLDPEECKYIHRSVLEFSEDHHLEYP